MKLSERHTFEKPAGSQEDQVVNVDGKGRQACLEVPGIVLGATLPGPIKWNYVASQRMCVVKITMASTGPRSSDSPGPASGRSRADVSGQPKQCGHQGHRGSPQGRRPKGWGSEASSTTGSRPGPSLLSPGGQWPQVVGKCVLPGHPVSGQRHREGLCPGGTRSGHFCCPLCGPHIPRIRGASRVVRLSCGGYK